MTTVTLPNGDDAEASFTVTTEKTDNGMDGPHRQDWLEVSAYLDELTILIDGGREMTIRREDAVRFYGETWVCGIEEDAVENCGPDDNDGSDDYEYENRREERE